MKISEYSKLVTQLTKITFFVICCCLFSCERLPDEVDVKELPSYYVEYLDQRIKSINKTIEDCSGNFEIFFWITDIHWEPSLNERHSPAMIKYIAERTGINRILNGGDTGNAKLVCSNAIERLRDAIGSDYVYTVTGNHEITDASKYERPFKRVANTLRGNCPYIVYGDENNSYFYFDDNLKKTRYIGLSAYGYFRNDACESGYTSEQLLWLNNIALQVDMDWTIIVFTHTLFCADAVTDKLYETPSGALEIIDVIDNYKGPGRIACVLMGHSHRDRIHLGKTGIPYIISSSDRHASHYYNGISDINVERVVGTLSEHHFEVVVVDKEKREVKLLSIGAQARNGIEDDPGELVDERIISYE